MATKSKAKGNAFEIKISKLLSQWMFNNPNLLWRESTSGARKIIYNGDIVPAKIEEYPWKTWPFIIECKHGYKDHIPTLMNQDKIRFWLSKLLSEKNEIQFIPILITKFHNSRKTLFITTILLNSYCDICLKHFFNNIWHDFYIYDLEILISQLFNNVIPNEILQKIL